MLEYEQNQEELRRKRLDKQLDENKQRRELEEGIEQKIEKLFVKKNIKKYFKDNDGWMRQIFDFYLANFKTDNWQKTNVLSYHGFMKLCAQMNIFPLLMDSREVQLLYRSTTRNQKIDKRMLKGINFKEFQEALVRISMKKTQVLNAADQELKQGEVS